MGLIDVNVSFPLGLKDLPFLHGNATVTIASSTRFAVDFEGQQSPDFLRIICEFVEKLNAPVFLKVVNDPEIAGGFIKMVQNEENELFFKTTLDFGGFISQANILSELQDFLEPRDAENGKFSLVYFVENKEFGLTYHPLSQGISVDTFETAQKEVDEAAEIAAVLAASGLGVGDSGENKGNPKTGAAGIKEQGKSDTVGSGEN